MVSSSATASDPVVPAALVQGLRIDADGVDPDEVGQGHAVGTMNSDVVIGHGDLRHPARGQGAAAKAIEIRKDPFSRGYRTTRIRCATPAPLIQSLLPVTVSRNTIPPQMRKDSHRTTARLTIMGVGGSPLLRSSSTELVPGCVGGPALPRLARGPPTDPQAPCRTCSGACGDQVALPLRDGVAPRARAERCSPIRMITPKRT